jgi:8-oxo-(d)GTP phosphatase
MPNHKPPDSKDSKLVRAAGAVAWRPGPDGGPEVLLVHRKKYDDWSLPKGKQEPGEPLALTAAREVFEEGGARLILGRRLTSVRYQVGGRPKRVWYWAAKTADTDGGVVPNAEVDQVAWLPLPQAWQRVSYGHDVGVLEDFASRPAGTVPLILLRHASAMPKSNWNQDDAARPLDDSGRAEADTLARVLACFAPSARVISSAAARCLQTVRPYAELIGAEVRAEPALHIQSVRTDGADSAALIADAVAAGEPAVFCVHRENMLSLQAAAAAALGVPDGAGSPGDSGSPGTPGLPADWDTPLPTAGFWVLHLTRPHRPARRRWFGRRGGGHGAGGTLVAADRYDLSGVLALLTRARSACPRSPPGA